MIAVGRTGRETCQAAAYATWLETSGITERVVFRGISRHGWIGARLSPNARTAIVETRAAAAALEPTIFSGHSMRVGFATSAAQAGLEERTIMCQTRHKSAQTVRRYIREGELFTRNLAQEVGL